ncbi:MAG: alcohol dehydrogenase catalytic domain-containing protein [Phycisphaerales bacterium]
MLAIRSDGSRLTADASTPNPDPTPGHALLSLRLATLSHDDLRAARPDSGFVGTLGHECIATVERISPDERTPTDAPKRLNNARVLLQPSIPCARCELCQRGLAAHCPSALLPGRKGLNGCLSERFTAPIHALTPIPDALDDERAIMAYALARALHHARVAALSSTAWATVMGDGPDALLSAQVLSRDHPATRLLAREESAIALCAKWGLKHRDASEAGRRQDQDLVLLASRTPSDFPLALSFLKPRATLLLAEPPSAPVSLEDAHAREIRILSSHAASLADAIPLLTSGAVDVAPLLGKRYRLQDAPLAFRDLAQERGPRKPVITP